MSAHKSKPAIITPQVGRRYEMGPMSAIFKVDEAEGTARLSISEWWLEPDTGGPPPHAHEEDHVFYVLEGTLAVMIDGVWQQAERGAYILLPGGTEHSFENRSDARVGFMSVNTPGGFEQQLPAIVEWFEDKPLGPAGREG
ncbi:MAG: cupin domain-containing protein [Alphaproteobacteria bacterium]